MFVFRFDKHQTNSRLESLARFAYNVRIKCVIVCLLWGGRLIPFGFRYCLKDYESFPASTLIHINFKKFEYTQRNSDY